MNLNPSRFLRFAALALIVACLPARAEDSLRPQVGKPLQDAQKDIQAKKYQEALGAVEEAEKVGGLTPYESFILNQLRGAAASGLGDYGTAATAYEKVVAAKKLAPEEQLRATEGVAGLWLRAKNYPKAIQWTQTYRDQGGTRPETLAFLPQAYYLSGDYKKAAQEAAAQVAAGEKAGRTPAEDTLKLLSSSQVKQNDMAGYTASLEKMVRYYPRPEYWTDLIQRTAGKPGVSSALDLDMYRLLRATDNLSAEKDYMEMAQLAVQSNVPGEAKAVVDEAYAKKIFGAPGANAGDLDRQVRLKALVDKKYATDKDEIAGTDSAAASAASGDPLVKVGLAYVTYGNPTKGLPMMEKGIAKGQLKAPEQAKLHLGYGYWVAGDKAKAQATFKTVGGNDGAADYARLWGLVK